MTRLTLALTLLAAPAFAQSDSPSWHVEGAFDAMSNTALSITGALSVWGQTDIGEPGGTMTLGLETGAELDLISEGFIEGLWGYDDEASTFAEVFWLETDPGELLNGNTLCGDQNAETDLYVAFQDLIDATGDPLLTVAVFQSDDVPTGLDSDGLCGTYTYIAESL